MNANYLYVYYGAGGPITVALAAHSLNRARAIVQREQSEWFDAAEDCLGLPLSAPHEAVVEAATDLGFIPIYALDDDAEIWTRD